MGGWGREWKRFPLARPWGVVEQTLQGYLESVHRVGDWLLHHDRADIGNPDAHPGVHHWHIGAGLIALSDFAFFLDTAMALLPSEDPLPGLELEVRALVGGLGLA